MRGRGERSRQPFGLILGTTAFPVRSAGARERGSAAAALMASAASSAAGRRSGRAYSFRWTAKMT